LVSSTPRAELAGGVASALLTLPLSIGFGLFALSPLGERYAGYGVLAGLYSAIIVALVAVLLRANSAIVFAPRSMQAAFGAIGAVTCLLMLYAGKLTKRIPAVIIGMFAGIGLYYFFLYIGYGA